MPKIGGGSDSDKARGPNKQGPELQESERKESPDANQLEEALFVFSFGVRSTLSERAPLEAREREAEEIRRLEEVGQRITEKLRELHKEGETAALTESEVEWLFFAAFDFQFSTYGGNSPSLTQTESDDDVIPRYELSWTGGEVLSADDEQDILKLLLRHDRGPRAFWTRDFLGDEGADISYYSVAPQLSVDALTSDLFRSQLVDHLKKHQNSSHDCVYQQTVRMISEESYFGDSWTAPVSGNSNFVVAQEPVGLAPLKGGSASGEETLSLDALVDQGIRHANLGEMDQAISLWEQGAERGDTRSMYNLALALEQSNPGDALTWLMKAAEGGHPDAANNLSEFFLREADRTQALYWSDRAIELGSVLAMVNRGVDEVSSGNIVRGKEILEEAAALGSPLAMRNLGLVAKDQGDVPGARAWWIEAAGLGDQESLVYLGELPDSDGG
jgi:tetratricopeptide (TPR) repeat protein